MGLFDPENNTLMVADPAYTNQWHGYAPDKKYDGLWSYIPVAGSLVNAGIAAYYGEWLNMGHYMGMAGLDVLLMGGPALFKSGISAAVNLTVKSATSLSLRLAGETVVTASARGIVRQGTLNALSRLAGGEVVEYAIKAGQLTLNGIVGATGELGAEGVARSLGETVIRSQYSRGAVQAGFDFLSFTGEGASAQLFINEVKHYIGEAALRKFTTFGFGKSGNATFRTALRKAEEAIMGAGLDSATRDALIAQLRSKQAFIRLVGGAETEFATNTLKQIGQKTGFITGEGFRVP